MTGSPRTIAMPSAPMALHRTTAAFLMLAGLTLALILINVGIGSVYFSPSQI